jgi:cobalt/nickel transport system permease protein
MAIAGPYVAWGAFWLTRRVGGPMALGIFLAAALGDLATYVVTSAQLALAFPDPVGGFVASFTKFGTIFAVTQVPLAIIEGLVTVVIFNMLTTYGRADLDGLALFAKEAR